MQNYLKVLWSLQEWQAGEITNSALAEAAGVKLSTVSDALRKLRELGLIVHERYGTIALTELGEELAVGMIRRHRLLETFLVRLLDYEWDEVHEEADRLEHAVSDALIARMERVLGYPTKDPHGDPIPGADGRVLRPAAAALSTVVGPCQVRVERISDAEAPLLQFFASKGVLVDAVLTVLPSEPYAETVAVSVPGGETLRLGPTAAGAVWVSLLP